MNTAGIGKKIVVVVALIAGLVFLLQPEVVPVEVQTVSTGPLTVFVQAEGRTRPIDRYVVSANSAGRLLRPQWREGDEVKQGELLGRVLPPSTDVRSQAVSQAQLQVAIARERAAQASLVQAHAEHTQAKAEWDRRQALHMKGHISTELLDSAQQIERVADAQRVAAQASLAAAQAEVISARAQLQGLDANAVNDSDGEAVLSPISGSVLKVHQKSEKLVLAGEPLFELAAQNGLEIEVDLLTRSAVHVQPGAIMLMDDWGGDQTLEGTVRYLEPDAFTKVSALGVEEQRVNVIGDFIETPQGLGSGYRLNVRIATWHGEDVLKVPNSAVFRRDRSWHCFVVDKDERAQLRALSIAHRGLQASEVIQGLEIGDQVIVFPSDQLQSGNRVEVLQRAETH